MTSLENAAKNQIINQLRSEGYPTYARLFDLFDLKLVDDPQIVGYMMPGEALIALNQNLNIDQVSVIVRHEILHEYLTHAERELAYDKQHNIADDHEIGNIAADYEISNRGYTDKDKRTIRSLVLNNDTVRGLVTEDDYPDWQNDTFEDMYGKLLRDKNKIKQQLNQYMKDLFLDSDTLDKIKDALNQEGQEGQEGKDGKEGQEGGEGQEGKDGKEGKGRDSYGASPTTRVIKNSLNKEIQQTQKDIKQQTTNQGGGTVNGNGFFPDREKQKSLSDRVAKIKRAFDDLRDLDKTNKSNNLFSEVNTVQTRDNQKRVKDVKEREYKKYLTQGLSGFQVSLQRFIRDYFGEKEESTWSKINPHTVYSGILEPGWSDDIESTIPSINVYWDISGSFSDPAKTAGAEAAIKSLYKYQKAKKLRLRVYYLTETVDSDRNSGYGGGGSGAAVIDHVMKTRPNNVIVITDGDANDCHSSPKITIPGSAWYLFYDEEAPALVTHLQGKHQTKVFDIEY